MKLEFSFTLKDHLENCIFGLQDFEGQARAESLSRIIVVLFGIVGLLWGYVIQQFSQTVYILGAGLLLAAIVSELFKNPLNLT